MNRQVAADPVKALFEKLLGWLPSWLGFVLIILAGVLAIVVGAVTPDAGFIAFGVAAIVSSVLAWWSGATSKPVITSSSFGGVVTNVDGWVWWVVFGLFVAAALITIFTR